MQHTPLKLVVAAGGTGGHLFPAIAVAEALQRLTQGSCSLDFIGTPTRIESRVVPQAGYRFHTIPATGLRKTLSLSTIAFVINTVRSIARSRALLRSAKPDAVLCTGAYISYPVGMAAAFLGIPVFLMESNVYPGKAILQLASRAHTIFTSFEESTAHFPLHTRARIRVVGNPVRSSLSALPTPQQARVSFGLAPDKPTVLCFGGSLGANSINAAMETALPTLANAGIQCLWQTGSSYTPSPELVRRTGASVHQFIDNMGTAYAAADVAICRAGATSIAELCATGTPSILVPYPHAANNHQEGNALAMQQHHAALMLDDRTLGNQLAPKVVALVDNAQQIATMRTNALALANTHADTAIAKYIMDEVQAYHKHEK